MANPTINIPNGMRNPNPKRIIPVVAVILVAIVGLNVLRASFISVDANEIGIEIVRGKVQGTLNPGWHLISPIGGKVSKFSTRLQQTSMLRTAGEGDRAGDDSIEVASSEGARMNVDLTIGYRLNKADAVQLFRTIRSEEDLRERVVRPGVRSVMRDVFALYKAKDAITGSRGEIQGIVTSRLNEKFSKQGLTIETIDIREIYLPPTIQEQVDQSIAAEAANQKVAIQRKQKETEAETARLVAEKAAEQARIEAKGKADAAIITATGEADANRRIAESLSPGLIQLRQIEAVYKNGNQIYFLPQGASPNVFLTPSNNLGTPSTPTAAQQSAAAAATTTDTTIAP